jgi:hypothetical protein
MEEMIWVYVGVIAIIIAFASIGSFLYKRGIQDSETVMTNTVTALSQFCDKICQMPQFTRQSVKVTFIKNSIMEMQDGVVFINTPEKRHVLPCNCVITNVQLLNLTNAPFNSHEYFCFFDRNLDGISINCTG